MAKDRRKCKLTRALKQSMELDWTGDAYAPNLRYYTTIGELAASLNQYKKQLIEFNKRKRMEIGWVEDSIRSALAN